MPRQRTPEALRALHGYPDKRPPRSEPKFTGVPKPPAHLTARAKRLWTELMREFGDIGLITGPDRYTFAVYVQATARAMEAEEILSKEGQMIDEPIVTRSGNISGTRRKSHPMVQAALKWHALAMQSAAKFGLNPSDRSRVNLPEQLDAGSPTDVFENDYSVSDYSPAATGENPDDPDDASWLQ
jgi:P27 family predicted phage terminase small subunit